MPAPEPTAEPRRHPAPSLVTPVTHRAPAAPGAAVSMRDLLASCAAAEAVSRPPRAPEPHDRPAARGHREAA
ncbi:hypothetical protein ABZ733_03020 [Streptomyces longwoodensis]|uniref:hypothetical protein n=1 Tax=Streptomyces longwoodensis TaxID=68231 RepID=UPI0033E3CB64